MPNINVLYENGIKSIDFSPWGGIDGFLEATSGGQATNVNRLRQIVPWLNKAVDMTANAVAQLPYCIESGEVEIDEEVAWGGCRNPQTVLQLVAASLCGGSAYVLVDAVPGSIVDLRYLAPNTIEPVFNINGDVEYFKRTISGKTQAYSKEQILHFWLPDDTVEVGPAIITPLSNAIPSASLMAAMDEALIQYGKRGFIPPTILSAKGMTNKSDVEKTEKWWNAFLRGWTKTVAKIINAETMTPSVLGAGMDEMRGSYIEILSQQIKNIAASFGIPLSTFLSDEANYATANADLFQWYSSGRFVTIYQTMEDVLDEQLFSRFGWSFEYEPEKLDVFQVEVNDKANSLSSLAGAFATNPQTSIIAADLLGIELSDEDKAALMLMGKKSEPATPESILPTPPESILPKAPESILPTAEENIIAARMLKWRTFAQKPHKHEFDTKGEIPAALELRIRAGLREAKTVDEIDAVFDAATSELPIIMLAKAIENAKNPD
jgi:hypothetical protein